jgi:hypothetical protein
MVEACHLCRRSSGSSVRDALDCILGNKLSIQETECSAEAAIDPESDCYSRSRACMFLWLSLMTTVSGTNITLRYLVSRLMSFLDRVDNCSSATPSGAGKQSPASRSGLCNIRFSREINGHPRRESTESKDHRLLHGPGICIIS